MGWVAAALEAVMDHQVNDPSPRRVHASSIFGHLFSLASIAPVFLTDALYAPP
ncbi:hypothetical protein DES32_0186 [Methylovirgula ligni]|uniref:Uncharacterized protein n=1 Tax=Methylovirgula ligni TaxID=569860 RepID=A0A3D9Z1C0_9HYPH|nr:hypothetical protein DES32_0186 [Methylovirgula ligni]